MERARRAPPFPEGAIVGQPSGGGRATCTIRLTAPVQFSSFRTRLDNHGTSHLPAWTLLFGLAAAVVTDGGTLVAHGSMEAREYGLPAGVGTGDATHRLIAGQWVTVDGTTGTVNPTSPAQQ